MDEEAKLFKALGDPLRVRLVVLLALRGETCVCDLAKAVQEPQYKISRHLAILRAAKVVTSRRRGPWMYYGLDTPRCPAAERLYDLFRTYSQDPRVISMLKQLARSARRDICAEENGTGTFCRAERLRLLFLCTGNSCRSQMAEGWARTLLGDQVDVWSAGIEKHGLNPMAVRVMAEAGVDISKQFSKTVDELPDLAFDWVVTVCGHAQEHCPLFPGGVRRVHAGFDDPPALAAGARTEEEVLNVYRRVRDEIRDFVQAIPDVLEQLWLHQTAGTDVDNSVDPSGSERARAAVRAAYGRVVAGDGGCCGPSASCGSPSSHADALARALGYGDMDLALLPEGANLGLSCGNPTVLAGLCPGEVVLDLGCGGGFDVFIAGRRVGAAGRVIGVDMTPEMIVRARRNALVYRQRTGMDNVEFRLGEIEHLPVADASVDVIISNCVINLSADKPRVWREMMRVLKPGGRVAVTDMALLRPMPEAIQHDLQALVGCIAGAELAETTRNLLRSIGFVHIRMRPRPEHTAAMFDASDPVFRQIRDRFPEASSPQELINSLEITAEKPGSIIGNTGGTSS